MDLNPRCSARAIILDEGDRILLCRFVFPLPAVPGPAKAVWAAPGGGIASGEDRLTALRRELREETGLEIAAAPPHVWHQVVVAADHAAGYDGIVNDYIPYQDEPLRTPRGLAEDQLARAESLAAFRWWRFSQIAGYTGPDLFSPRDLAASLAELLTAGTPAEPAQLGL
jgi:ADP-ribose pyrophosphatase YjhB (NUDIX family)